MKVKKYESKNSSKNINRQNIRQKMEMDKKMEIQKRGKQKSEMIIPSKFFISLKDKKYESKNSSKNINTYIFFFFYYIIILKLTLKEI